MFNHFVVALHRRANILALTECVQFALFEVFEKFVKRHFWILHRVGGRPCAVLETCALFHRTPARALVRQERRLLSSVLGKKQRTRFEWSSHLYSNPLPTENKPDSSYPLEHVLWCNFAEVAALHQNEVSFLPRSFSILDSSGLCNFLLSLLKSVVCVFVCWPLACSLCRVELCSFSGHKIHPGHGRRLIRVDGKVSWETYLTLLDLCICEIVYHKVLLAHNE